MSSANFDLYASQVTQPDAVILPQLPAQAALEAAQSDAFAFESAVASEAVAAQVAAAATVTAAAAVTANVKVVVDAVEATETNRSASSSKQALTPLKRDDSIRSVRKSFVKNRTPRSGWHGRVWIDLGMVVVNSDSDEDIGNLAAAVPTAWKDGSLHAAQSSQQLHLLSPSLLAASVSTTAAPTTSAPPASPNATSTGQSRSP